MSNKRRKTESKQSTVDWTKLGRNPWIHILSFLTIAENGRVLRVSKVCNDAQRSGMAWCRKMTLHGFGLTPAKFQSLGCVRPSSLLIGYLASKSTSDEDLVFGCWQESLREISFSWHILNGESYSIVRENVLGCVNLEALMCAGTFSDSTYFLPHLESFPKLKKLVCKLDAKSPWRPEVVRNLEHLNITFDDTLVFRPELQFTACMANLHTLLVECMGKGNSCKTLHFQHQIFPKLRHLCLDDIYTDGIRFDEQVAAQLEQLVLRNIKGTKRPVNRMTFCDLRHPMPKLQYLNLRDTFHFNRKTIDKDVVVVSFIQELRLHAPSLRIVCLSLGLMSQRILASLVCTPHFHVVNFGARMVKTTTTCCS